MTMTERETMAWRGGYRWFMYDDDSYPKPPDYSSLVALWEQGYGQAYNEWVRDDDDVDE